MLALIHEAFMDNLKIYNINPHYIDYLGSHAPHLFGNKGKSQRFERKYTGVVLHINGYDYFAPLSSFKDKHKGMSESIDMIKLGEYAVINLNCMFPCPCSECSYVDINKERDPRYRSLLLSEYRIIKSKQAKIRKNAETLYKIKTQSSDITPLTKRCNDFILLERLCKEFT